MTFQTYLVEDSPVIRENLVDFLEDVADAKVVASASTEAGKRWAEMNGQSSRAEGSTKMFVEPSRIS